MERREVSLLCPESSVPELASVLGVCERHLLRLVGWAIGDNPSCLHASIYSKESELSLDVVSSHDTMVQSLSLCLSAVCPGPLCDEMGEDGVSVRNPIALHFSDQGSLLGESDSSVEPFSTSASS